MSEDVVAKIRSFKDLKVWQKGVDLVETIYKVTKTFPKEEMYGLSAQLRRAAVSIPSNIAEGFGRHHYKENSQFCRISRGSLYELIDDLITSKDENYIDDNVYDDLRIKIALKILIGNIGYLSNINN